MKLFGSIKELVSAVFRKDTYEVTLRPNQSTTYTAARDIQLPAKDGNAVLVSSGDIVNNDINASAAIAYSKLALSNSIVNADVSSTAAIDASKIGGGLVSNTEFSYLDGVTSAIQTQINSKQATITGAATTITSSDLTASKALQSDASGKVSASTVTSTELGYVSGVTSAIQTQLGNKASSGANSDITSLFGLTTPLSSGQGGTGINNGGTLTYGANNISLTTSGATSLTLPTTGTVTTTSNKLSAFASTSSSELAGVISDETGSGSLVFGTSPTLSSPQVNSSLVVQQIATPSNPSAGFDKIYTKSDGILYKLDSAGNEVAVGSGAGGSGEVNTILNPSAATDTTGWAAATNYTVAKDSANSPLSPAVSTSFAMSTTIASAESNTSGISYASFTMPAALQNRKLKVEFFANIPATSTGVWRMSLYDSGGTRVALSTDSSSVTTLPGGVTGKFVAYFDATSSATYSLRLTQTTRTSPNTLYITNVIVGPGIQPQGAVVGEWTSYTPAWTASTTNPSLGNGILSGRYRRVGDTLQYHIHLTMGSTTTFGTNTWRFGLPTGLSVDFTKIGTAGNDTGNHGSGIAYRQSTGTFKTIMGRVESGNPTVITAAIGESTTNLFITSAFPWTWATNDALNFTGSVPIAQWAGSGTVQLAQNDVEYVANDGTNNVYGPAGTAMPSTSAGATTRTVTFQTPIQATDVLTVEYAPSLGGQWLSNVTSERGGAGANWLAYSSASEVGWGEVRQVSSTQVTIVWRRYKLGTTNWGGSADGYWRVRKSSAGAAVGFGIVQPGTSAGLVSASGVPGNTTGNAIASGFVGETQPFITRSVAGGAGSFATNSSALVTLTTGTWLVYGTAVAAVTTVPQALAISTSTTGGSGIISQANLTTNSSINAQVQMPVVYFSVTAASQPLYMQCYNVSGTATGSVSGFAVRIA
jgi:hypothetical protein